MLNSKKLIALIAGQIAVVFIVGMAIFNNDEISDYREPIAIVAGMTTGAIGMQGVIDLTNSKTDRPVGKSDQV